MALIGCPECDKQVSSSAATCPNCGVAIATAGESKAAGAALTTVQRTSKKLKFHSLISVVAIIIGTVMLIAQVEGGGEPGEASAIPSLLLTFGLLWFVVTRIRIWWHHE